MTPTTSLTSLCDLGLRAFPPEIRQMIFTFSNLLVWTGKTPALLVALRGDCELYAEALEYFYKNNVFRLHAGNEWQTGDMAISALQAIKALSIDFWSSEDCDDWEDGSSGGGSGGSAQTIAPSTHDFARHRILHATALQSLHLDARALTAYTMAATLDPAATCAARLPRLRRVSVALPRIVPHRAHEPYDASGAIEHLVGAFNRALGCPARLMAVGARCEIAEMQVWFWEGGFATR